MKARPVVHFEILGKNAATLREFYSSLFGWKIDANNPMDYGMVAPGEGGPDHGIGGGIARSDDGPRVLFYVQVADPAETLRKAEGMGGRTVMPPTDVPGGPTIAQFEDPEGNRLGLIKQ